MQRATTKCIICSLKEKAQLTKATCCTSTEANEEPLSNSGKNKGKRKPTACWLCFTRAMEQPPAQGPVE